jgi:protein-tyrosine phosphatase
MFVTDLSTKKVRVLFVCMGNICRSPTAEAVTRALLAKVDQMHAVELDSAGTHDYHIGNPPDGRMQKAAARRGYDLSGLRARQVEAADFARFDLVLAMDRDNLQRLVQRCPDEYRGKLKLFLDYAPGETIDEVPDPYYGGSAGFDRVLDLVEHAARGLIEALQLK